MPDTNDSFVSKVNCKRQYIITPQSPTNKVMNEHILLFTPIFLSEESLDQK